MTKLAYLTVYPESSPVRHCLSTNSYILQVTWQGHLVGGNLSEEYSEPAAVQ